MLHKTSFLIAFVSILGCSLVFAQATVVSDPRPNKDAYQTEDFGNCTFGYGKDRTRYIQPYLVCKSGLEEFVLVPQKDGAWGMLITPGDVTEREGEEEPFGELVVTIKVDENDDHEFELFWPRRFNMAFESLELSELARLLDELRHGDSMTISRNGEVIEFDLNGANRAFTDLLFEQLAALNREEQERAP